MAVSQLSPAKPRERLTVSLPTFRKVANVAIVLLVLIVFSGAAVRLTGSGLGCPDWPQCHGTLTPELSSHVAMEYGNRLLSALVGIPCLLLAGMAFRLRPFRRELVVPAVLLPLGVAAQGILGGLTVIFDLSWEMVIAHYLLSIVLLVAAVVLVWRLRRGPGAARPELPRSTVFATRALVLWGAYVVTAGTFATAAGPHAGGAGTGDYVERLSAFGDDTLRTLIHLHGHSGTALGLGAVALWVLARRRGADPRLLGALTAVCVLIALQGAIGLIQYHTQLPAAVVWVHASLAAVLWIALVTGWLAAGRVKRAAA